MAPWNHPPNPSRVRLEAFLAEAGRAAAPGALVLDAGAGDCRYSKHFTHARYESADFLQVDKPYADVDYVCSLDAIPVEDDRFDLVVFTQVMEHLPEPGAVLDELARVMKPGARLWMSAPLFYPEHEVPYDFYRYTQFGFRHRLAQAGFEVERLEWLEGYFGTLAFQLRHAVQVLPRHPAAYGRGIKGVMTAAAITVARPAMSVLAGVLGRAELRRKHTSTGHPKNYVVVARRA